jgi:hypothetical protein
MKTVMNEADAPLTATEITEWKVAKKTKPLRAKPVVNLLVDRSVLNKFLVDTLEAKEPIHEGNVICIGETNDAWQQEPKKLLKKYQVTAIDKDGWMVCEPYPDNSVDCFQVDFLINTHSGEHYLKALWGETFGSHSSCQRFAEGDWILRNREDHNDVWVVRKKLFANSYTIIG